MEGWRPDGRSLSPDSACIHKLRSHKFLLRSGVVERRCRKAGNNAHLGFAGPGRALWPPERAGYRTDVRSKHSTNLTPKSSDNGAPRTKINNSPSIHNLLNMRRPKI